jgi:hypothetical protein
MIVTDEDALLSCNVCQRRFKSLHVIYLPHQVHVKASEREYLELCDGCVDARNKARQRITVIRDSDDPQRG